MYFVVVKRFRTSSFFVFAVCSKIMDKIKQEETSVC